MLQFSKAFESFINKYSSTASINNYTNAAGIGVVSGNVYLNKSGSPVLLADALGSSAVNIGAANGATVSAAETGAGGFLHKTVLTLTATPITLLDTGTGAGLKIYDFPEGAITILGATGSIALTTTSILANTLNTGVTVSWAVGSVTQQAGTTMATTEVDILPSTSLTASATINVAGAASGAVRTAAPAILDGTGTAKDAFINFAIPTATDIDADATCTITGTVTIIWSFNGDV